MASHVLLKVTRMAKVSPALLADEAALVEVYQHVVVEGVLPREGRRAELADVGLQAGVLLIVEDEAVRRGELLVGAELALVDERLVAVHEDGLRRRARLLANVVDVVEGEGAHVRRRWRLLVLRKSLLLLNLARRGGGPVEEEQSTVAGRGCAAASNLYRLLLRMLLQGRVEKGVRCNAGAVERLRENA